MPNSLKYSQGQPSPERRSCFLSDTIPFSCPPPACITFKQNLRSFVLKRNIIPVLNLVQEREKLISLPYFHNLNEYSKVMSMSFFWHQAGKNMKGDTFHHGPIYPITGGSYMLHKFIVIPNLNRTPPRYHTL